MAGVTSDRSVIRVILVDDDPLVRAGLGMILRGAADIEIVGEAGDGADVEALTREVAPDVVLMDIRMPRVDGLEATRTLAAEENPPRIIVLTTFDADEYVVRALADGAAAIETLQRGEVAVVARIGADAQRPGLLLLGPPRSAPFYTGIEVDLVASVARCVEAALRRARTSLLRSTQEREAAAGRIALALAHTVNVALLLRAGRLRAAFFAGIVCDNTLLLLGWWVTARADAGLPRTTDLYLVLFPVLAVGAARFGWLFGSLYGLLWIAWLAWTTFLFAMPGRYDLEQLPVRLVSLSARGVGRGENERVEAGVVLLDAT